MENNNQIEVEKLLEEKYNGDKSNNYNYYSFTSDLYQGIRMNIFYFYSHAKTFIKLLETHSNDLLYLTFIIEFATKYKNKEVNIKKSLRFNHEFYENDGLNIVLNLIENHEFIDKQLETNNGKVLIRNLFLILINLSLNEENEKSVWINLNVEDILINFKRNYKNICNYSEIINQIFKNIGIQTSSKKKKYELSSFIDFRTDFFNEISSEKLKVYYKKKKLANLFKLNLISFDIKVINYDSFKDVNNIVMLNLGHNLIESIHPETFNFLVNLKILKLNNNFLNEVNENTFNNLKKLEEIGLSNNKIKIIHEKTFFGLDDLERLFLDRNLIQLNDVKPFKDLKSLKTLCIFSQWPQNDISLLHTSINQKVKYLNKE